MGDGPAGVVPRSANEKPLILISNDDGIEAPGLQALVRGLDALGDVWVVAPAGERSTASQALTLRRPVPVKEVGPRAFAVDGWPADCVYLGLFGLLPRRPDLVVSGINAGPNLGIDLWYSGTAGAAREAFTRGVPALAVSLVDGEDYDAAGRVAMTLVRAMIALDLPSLFLNVNVPAGAVRGMRVCSLGPRHYPERARRVGQRGDWTLYELGAGIMKEPGPPGSDVEAVADGYASVTPLTLDQADHGLMEAARRLAERATEHLLVIADRSA